MRCRALQRRALQAGFRGQLCFTLPEALWLADQGFDDLVVAYPTADRAALRALAHGPHRAAIALMIDSRAHLDLIQAADTGNPKALSDLRVLYAAVPALAECVSSWQWAVERDIVGGEQPGIR